MPRLTHFLTAVTATIPVLLLVASMLPTWLSLQFIVSLFALWSLSYSVETSAEALGSTRFVTVFLVPFLTTLPELISTVYLVMSNHPVAGLLTFVGSAVFDLFLVLPILARGDYLDRTIVLLLLFCMLPLPVTMLVLIDMKWHIVTQLLLNAGITLRSKPLGLVLTLLGVVVTLLVAVWGTHKLFNPEYRGAQLLATIITFVSAVIAFTYTCMEYSSMITALCSYIPGNIAGILNAYLTSLPDAIYAAAAAQEGHTDEGIGELWSCVVHDYTVVPGIALLLGGAISATLGQALYMLAVPIALILTLSPGDMRIDRKERIALFSLFALFTVLALLL